MDTDLDQPDPSHTAVRRFTAVGTAACLALWLTAVLLESIGTSFVADPMADFEHPVEVAVRAVETPLAMSEAALATAGEQFEDLAPDVEQAMALPRQRENGAALYLAVAERLEALASEAEDLAPEEDAEPAAQEASLRRSQVAELQLRAALLAFEDDGADVGRWIPADQTDPRAVAVRSLLTGAEDPIDAALFDDLEPSVSTDVLRRRLAEREGDTEAAERWSQRGSEFGADRLVRVLALVGLAGGLGLVGLVTLVLLRFAPPAATRMDRPADPTTFPEPDDGVGLFARYAFSFLMVSLVVGLVLLARGGEGLSPLLGITALLCSAPLLWFAHRRYRYDAPGSLGRALGLGLAPARAWRLLPVAAAGWLASYAGVITLGLAFSGGDPARQIYANPFLDVIVGSTAEGRLRLLVEACLWAPLFEELAFRGALFGGLRRRLPFFVAGPVSAVLFALPHPYDPVGMAGIAWIGLVLAWVYERTRSLWAPIAAHCLFNLGQLLLSFTLFA